MVTDPAPRVTRLDIVNEERETEERETEERETEERESEDNISEFQLQEDCAIKQLREQVHDIKGIVSEKLKRMFSNEVLIKTMDLKIRDLLDNVSDS